MNNYYLTIYNNYIATVDKLISMITTNIYLNYNQENKDYSDIKASIQRLDTNTIELLYKILFNDLMQLF